MSTLGGRIREAREAKHLLQSGLALRVGVSAAVISNWEKDINKPDVEKLVALCKALEVSPAYLLDYWEQDSSLTLPEWVLLKKYRLLDVHGKKITEAVLSEEYARMTRHEEASVVHKDNLTFISCYDLAVSAGTGEPLGDTYYKTKLEIPTDRVPEEAHYCLRVNGNSMEPAYSDGDIVFVHRQDTCVSEGEIGIFFLNGEGYMKRLGHGALLSLNPDYAPIPIGEYDNLLCQGKVLGKL